MRGLLRAAGPNSFGPRRGVLIALLVGLLGPSSARAGCGDHVLDGPRPDPATPSHRTPNSPCQGPHCSRQDPGSPPAPVGAVRWWSTDPAERLSAPAPDPEPSAPLSHADVRACRRDAGQVFRPPRPSA